jgi:hypothetical protein
VTEYTDRYAALGMAWPNPATVCLGQCEGTGVYPMGREIPQRPGQLVPAGPREYSTSEVEAWEKEHTASCLSIRGRARKVGWAIRSALSCAFRDDVLRERFGFSGALAFGWNREIRCDGWHFITCPNCNGTGRRG